ncbi:MAG: potassium ABC transporter ATPase [Bacteroidota bacterium]
MDIIYLAVIIIFFLLTWGLMRLCEKLGQNTSGEKL